MGTETESASLIAAQVLTSIQLVLASQRRVEQELAGIAQGQRALGMALREDVASRGPPNQSNGEDVDLQSATGEVHVSFNSIQSASSAGVAATASQTASGIDYNNASLDIPELTKSRSGEGKRVAFQKSEAVASETSVDMCRVTAMWEVSQAVVDSEKLRSTPVKAPVLAGHGSQSLSAARALPATWPKNIDINGSYETGSGEAELQRFVRSGESLRLYLATNSESSRDDRITGTSSGLGFNGRWVLEPSSSLRVAFDLCSLVVLLYDLTSTPYLLAWDLPLNGFIQYMMYVTFAFWASDLMLNFRTGFYHQGELEMEPRVIARHYIKTFFLPDLCIVATDLVSVIINNIHIKNSEGPHYMNLMRIAKSSRILRILGVVRVAHLSVVFSRIRDRHRILQSSGIVISISQVLFLILWLNHVISCVWYALGNFNTTDTGAHWLGSPISNRDDTTYAESAMAYQYFTAFHWSLTQMTPGSMQVFPLNSWERQFNIMCLIFGMLFFTTLISTLSAKMTHVKLKMQENEKMVSSLRVFLRDSKVGPKLAIRAEKQVIERLQKKKPLTFDEVPAFKLISLSVRTDLQCAMYLPHLTSHPFMRVVTRLDEAGTRKLCNEAVSFIALSPGDVLFEPGKTATAAYSLISGGLKYMQHPWSSNVDNESVEHVPKAKWLCEAALWCHWKTVGAVEGITACKLLALNVSSFVDILGESHLLQAVAWQYAKSFHKRLVEAIPPKAPWPSDFAVPFTYAEVLISMKESARIFLGLVATEMHVLLGKGRRLVHEELANLEEEVRNGACNLTISETGEVQRVVAVLVVRVERDNGNILVQLGKWRGDHVEAACALPGTKGFEGESPADALRRFLSKELAPLMGCMQFDRAAEKQIEWKFSDRYQVKTKYIKNINHADFDEVRYSNELHPPTVMLNYARQQSSSDLERVMKPLKKAGSRGGVQLVDSTASLKQLEVSLLSDGASTFLYAWLEPCDYEYLGTMQGGQILKELLQGLEVSQEDVQQSQDLWARHHPDLSQSEHPGSGGQFAYGRIKDDAVTHAGTAGTIVSVGPGGVLLQL